MNKKNLFRTMILTAVAAIAVSSCDNANSKADNKSQANGKPTELKLAYVEIDSIMTQYNFCKEYSKVLEKKGQNIQNTLAQKQQALQNAGVNFQQKLQQNAYTREQAEGIQASLQKQAADLDALSQRLGNEFQAETEKFNEALRDSIRHFLDQYNKDKKYSIIFSKQGENLLYADKSYDITDDVIAGLNKSYKSTIKKEDTAAKTEKTAKK